MIDIDCGFAPFALKRKGLLSSVALKTRFYLSNGVPVISPSEDDAFSNLDIISQRKLGFFLTKGKEQFNNALEDIKKNKNQYYSSYRVRYFLKSLKILMIKESFMNKLINFG